MSAYIWYFTAYSFFGYLFEKAFAFATNAKRRVRKCFAMLPLCPVYGLSMCLIAATDSVTHALPAARILWGGTLATLVEYAMHVYYERALGVRFWDYSALRGNVRGRVCLLFSAAWGVLSALAMEFIHPVLSMHFAAAPLLPTLVVVPVLAFDAHISARILRATRDTEALAWQRAAHESQLK
ncbi:MAG: putative ABC transporter permease [Oscillospiraceae bacterium]|nr:putative ABC transporter permease [Oscillospiraceae bacterium]